MQLTKLMSDFETYMSVNFPNFDKNDKNLKALLTLTFSASVYTYHNALRKELLKQGIDIGVFQDIED